LDSNNIPYQDINVGEDKAVRINALAAAVEGLRIDTAALGNKAGVIGAAALARHRALE
jgi:hypothetical protein